MTTASKYGFDQPNGWNSPQTRVLDQTPFPLTPPFEEAQESSRVPAEWSRPVSVNLRFTALDSPCAPQPEPPSRRFSARLVAPALPLESAEQPPNSVARETSQLWRVEAKAQNLALHMPELPTGTVTFLFTDIEGSTRLLHELGEDYAEALSEHRRVIRAAFAHQGGVEVDTQGDAFFVAFARATDALAAARDAQQELEASLIRVRMGIHTGEPIVTVEGYVGMDVHKGARIAAVGHGGQVLVSQTTRDLCGDELLRDLGEHRLKDLTSPERIFQLGEHEFPPLKTLYRTNLPVPATRFVGRKAEIEALGDLLRTEVRLVTLTGPGGTGKTRLAMHAVAEAADGYPDGVWWVPLAALSDSSLVLSTVGQVLGARGELAEHIGSKRLLLLLDNFEHLVEAARDIGGLLGACPSADIVVTSRERLQVAGEHEYPVPPLEVSDGVLLFTERACSLVPDFEGNGDVHELCGRLDNLPLALELAAARTKLFSPAQLLERLGQRLDLLKGGRDADPRQRTLRATIEWSYDLLTDEERALFARMAVFSGGCTVEAAEEICDADPDTLQSLLDKSLLRRRESTGGEPRLWMLETIRAFASQKLSESGELKAIRRRHCEAYARLGEDLQAPFRDGDVDAIARVEVELDNFRAVLDWAAETGEPGPGFSIVWALWYFWVTRGLGAEGLRWALWAVAEREKLSRSEQALGLLGTSELIRFFGDVDLAMRLKQDLVVVFRELGDDRRVAATLADLAAMAGVRGDFSEARLLAEEALVLRRKAGAPSGISHALAHQGEIEFEAGDYERARALCEQSLKSAEESQLPTMIMGTVIMVGECARRCGDIQASKVHLRRGLTLARDLGQRAAFPELLQEIAAVAARPDSAVRLLGASDRLIHDIDVARWDPADYEETVRRVRAALDPAAFDSGWRDGLSLTDEDALALASESLD